METETLRIPATDAHLTADTAFVELGDEAFAHIDPLERSWRSSASPTAKS